MPKRRRQKQSSADTEFSTNQLLLALLQVLIDDREARADEHPKQIKTEVLLDRIGLGSATIATLVGKLPGAVRTTLSREKAKKKVR
jgi:hypothetical protein